MLKKLGFWTAVAAIGLGWIFLRPVTDREGWVIYECNDLAMVAFVRSDDTIEGYAVETGADVKSTLARVQGIPVQRRYFLNVARYCPYTKRRVL